MASDSRKENTMSKMVRAGLGLAVAGLLAGLVALPEVWAAPGSRPVERNSMRLSAANFVKKIDNPYYPLPVGRTLVYEGVRDGVTQVDRVTVTTRTKVIQGITARVVSDVAHHHGRLLEKTFDWFAQDKQGNVWYLGEDTKAYGPHGTIDTSGSWETGVDGAVAGIIMLAHPYVPRAYRQEFLKGEAEDTAWVVNRGTSVTVPYGTVHGVLTTLEATKVEPSSYDEKLYAPGIGIVRERSLTGDETARLVHVTG
jgi:hypothetical protein